MSLRRDPKIARTAWCWIILGVWALAEVFLGGRLNVAQAAGINGVPGAGSLPVPQPDVFPDGAGADLSAKSLPPVPRQFIVRFQNGIVRTKQNASLTGLGPGIRSIRWLGRGKSEVHPRIMGGSGSSVFDQLALVEVDVQADLNAALHQLRRMPEVLYVEPNYRFRLCDADLPGRVPADYEFKNQWSLHNTGQIGGLPGADIRAPEAWRFGTGDRRVIVAVIDTGIDYFHPDLEPNIWTNQGEREGNGVDDDGNGYIDDVHGYDFVSDDSDPMDDHAHGTHVAGIIGAAGDNRIGIAGVCWQVRLMALKAFDDNGDGNLADVISAIQYAARNGARIINASWTTSDRSVALKEAITAAHDAGVIIVAAAGNERSDTPASPAGYPEVIAVAATDDKDQRALYSNFGAYVALAAPGDRIFSTYPNASYGYMDGTSMAAPHVTGVAALVLANHPEFTVAEVETILRNAVDPLLPDRPIGAGRLNANKAVQVQQPLPMAALSLPAVLCGVVDFQGTARGDHFQDYELAYGAGIYPTNWIILHQAETPVDHGTLFPSFSTTRIPDGDYTIRLRVDDVFGQSTVDRAAVTVRNVEITAPQHNDVLRAGDLIDIRGTVFGSSRVFTIEHGQGWQPKTWSAEGITVMNQGQSEQITNGLLAVWDTRQVVTNEFYTLRLTARSNEVVVGESRIPFIYLDGQLRPGWPQYLSSETDYFTNDWREVVVADLDNDGFEEIIRLNPGNADGKPARLWVFGHDGRVRWFQDLDSGEPYTDVPVVGDVDGDGRQEIFVDVGSQQLLYAFHDDGTPLAGQWPVHLEVPNCGKLLADVNGDGYLELVVYAQNVRDDKENRGRQLLVYDHTGVLLRKWSFADSDLDINTPKMMPAVGNLDDDPDLEILAVMGRDQLGAFSMKKADGPLWKVATPGAFVGSPVVGDLDHDGYNEVIIGSYDERGLSRPGTRGGIYAFDRKGKLLKGWPVLVDESFAGTPALADFFGDGFLEIAVPSWFSKNLHLLQPNGFEASGWPRGPFSRTTVKADPVIGDINGDGKPDIVLGSPGQFMLTAMSGDLSTVGGVKAWAADGEQIDLNSRPELTGLVIESAGGNSRSKSSALTLTDIDHNGKLDIVATSIEDRSYTADGTQVVRKNRYSIYVWELDVPYVATNMPWRTFRGNPQHTGYLEPPKHVIRPPVVRDIPNQTTGIGRPFFPVELDRYVDDPDYKPSQIKWTVQGSQALQVVISTNRVAFVQPVNTNWSGRETLTFIAQDPRGLEAQDTATFAAQADYDAPTVTDDEASTPEDTPIAIDVLANDRDVRGGPLSLIQVANPFSGTAQIAELGKVVYTPAPFFNGQDSFTYIVANARGGEAIGIVNVNVTPVPHPPQAAPDWVITVEDTPVDIDPLANDIDRDGDTLVLLDFSQPTNGIVTTVSTNLLRYSPNPNTSGLDGFTYRITDGHGGTNEGVVTVMVKPVNKPPVVTDQTFTLNRNTEQTVIFRATDTEGDELSFKVVKAPDHGSIWAYPAVATYYPAKGFSGQDSITYQANDGEWDSAVATVTFNVLDVNNPPKAEEQSLVTKVGRPRPLTLKASDADDDPLTFLIRQLPVHGVLTGSQTNYTYTPESSYVGEDQFTFQASDGKDLSPEALVKIKVTDQNTAPVASNAFIEVSMNLATNILLRAADPENDSLKYIILTNPVTGTLTGEPPNLVYTPAPDYLGHDLLVFKVSDGELDSAPAAVTLNVVFPDNPPEAQDQTLALLSGQASVIELAVTDADGDRIKCAILKGPQFGRLIGAGTHFTYLPKSDYQGTDSFTYKPWDGHAYGPVATVSISLSSVLPPDKPGFAHIDAHNPSQVKLSLTTLPNTPLEIQSSTNLVDWTTIAVLTPATSSIDYTATNNAGLDQRFYRALWRK